jgi:hypothetical protein
MASAGDVFIAFSHDLADDGVLDAQPAAGGEAVIHNIWAAGAAEVYRHNGANIALVATLAAAGSLEWLSWHVTNTDYITIKNVNAAAADVGYDGMYTKATT